VNGGQINKISASTASALGGGSTFNPATGAITAPSYSVGGKNYGNVGDALAAGNSLAVQYVADAAGAPTNAVKLTGNGNGQPVALSNLAAGAVTATSTDAVNGGQLYTVQQSANGALQRTGGSMSGNIAMGGNRVTGLAGPIDNSDAATKGYVDTLQGQTNVQLQSLTSGLNGALKRIDRTSQGVALAIAMGGGFLSDDKKFSLWGGWGSFDGFNALAAQSYIRLTDDIVLNAGASFGLEDKVVGTRVGIGIQF
jgi:trimeric autotransporter adhesin